MNAVDRVRPHPVLTGLGALCLGLAVAACVKIPPRVQSEFAAALPQENSRFRRQSGAPSQRDRTTPWSITSPMTPAPSPTAPVGASNAAADAVGDPR